MLLTLKSFSELFRHSTKVTSNFCHLSARFLYSKPVSKKHVIGLYLSQLQFPHPRKNKFIQEREAASIYLFNSSVIINRTLIHRELFRSKLSFNNGCGSLFWQFGGGGLRLLTCSIIFSFGFIKFEANPLACSKSSHSRVLYSSNQPFSHHLNSGAKLQVPSSGRWCGRHLVAGREATRHCLASQRRSILEAHAWAAPLLQFGHIPTLGARAVKRDWVGGKRKEE